MPTKKTPLRYTVEVTRDAEESLHRLPRDLLDRVRQAIRSLATDPRPSGCKRLVGHEALYRLRVGDWRIIYAIEGDKLVVLVVEIGPRGRVYRGL